MSKSATSPLMNILPSRSILIQHLISVLCIVVINLIYFYPQLSGKKLLKNDIIQASSSSSEVKMYAQKTGKTYLWSNAQFGGMPRLVEAPAKNNLIWKTYDLLKLGFNEPIGLFIALMLLTYFMFVLLGVNAWLSLILSIGIGLSANHVILWEAGHASKIRTLAFTPLIITGVLYLFEKQKIYLGGILLLLGLTFSVFTRHPQMTYYIFLVFLIYGIIKAITFYKEKSLSKLGIGILITMVCGILALGASASKIWSMYEYNKSSIRGKPVLVDEKIRNVDATSSSEVEGLDWAYAMQWSNSTMDLLSGFIPGLVGGGSGQKVGKQSPFYKAYRSEQAPLYWGKLPFTEGPIYFGAVFVFLFVFGLFYYKGDLKWWLGLAVLVTLLLSMGRHFAFLNKLLFEYLPLYNKFRAPQSILSVTVLFLPILSGLAVQKLIQDTGKAPSKVKSRKMGLSPEFIKSIKWSLGICGGLALFFLLLGPSLFSFDSAVDPRYTQQGVNIDILKSARKSLMRTDSLRTLVLVLLAGGSLWYYAKKSITEGVMILILGVLVLFDMLSVSLRYVAPEDFVSQNRYASSFAARPVDQQILQREKGREFYRVLDYTTNTFNSSFTSNFHNHLGGNHAAKLQRIQDIIERHITKQNQQVLNMLNTKYVIVPGADNQPTSQFNPAANGNAWFIDHIKKVTTPLEEIDALNSINAKTEAVVLDTEFNNYISDFDPSTSPGNSITLSEYEPDHLTYQSQTASEQLAIFSEIWYGPKKGWQAYIDGKPVEHIRVNYLLRGLRIPTGSHTIEFKFKPRSYFTGEKIALGSSLIQILLIFGFLGIWIKDHLSKKNESTPIEKPKIKLVRKRKPSGDVKNKRPKK